MAKTELQVFLDQEIDKVKGRYYPVKAGLLRRVLIRTLPCRRLHPNPGDEFCFPEIGPNYEIVSRYMQAYRKQQNHVENALTNELREPLIVQKTKPDGYMILNGHHRWAAALRTGTSRVKVKVVDLTQEKDIVKMLERSSSDKRVTLDLDEVIFRPEGSACLEEPLRFPLRRIYPERIRMGIPALFHDLNEKGYDIWVYSASYYSTDYIRYFFRHYRVQVAGIVTGTRRKTDDARDAEKKQKLQKMMEDRYSTTVHIDNGMVLQSFRDSKEFKEFKLSAPPEGWAREVMEIIGAIGKK